MPEDARKALLNCPIIEIGKISFRGTSVMLSLDEYALGSHAKAYPQA